MKVFNILKNLWKFAKDYSDANLQTAKDYADNNLKLGMVTASISVSAGSTAWSVATIPNGQKLICPAGFYWRGGSNNSYCNIYAYYMSNGNQIEFALRNNSNVTASLTIDAYYLYI